MNNLSSTDPEVEEWTVKASEGEEESQLKLGQHYLALADSSVNAEENGKLAILWLTKASKQGNEAATAALEKCLETKTGITDENREDVKWCVSTSSLEKRIRYAARNMFHSINTAKKEVLSPEEYSAAIRNLTGGKEQKLLLAAGKTIGENISENDFVKVLSKKVQGTLTLTSSERSDAFEAASPIQKVLKFPRETVMALGDQALEFASKDGLSLVMSCVPTDQIYFLTLFFVYGFLTTKFLLLIVPLLLFYISMATILVTTLQMFYKKKKRQEANALAEVLKQYDVAVDVDQTQSQYTWNSLTPYIVFFLTIPLVVISFSLADKAYIPCAELCVLCAVLSGLCFVAISDAHDLITLLALFCNFLAALPVFLHNFPNIPVISMLLHLVSGSLVSVDLFGGLKLNIGIPSVCYCLIPIFFIQMAFRQSFQGMYRVLIPHLVCYFWFNLISTFYPFTTWFGLARATVGYLLLPLLIPLSFFIAILGLIYVFVKLLSSDMFGKIVITLLLACIPILLTQTKKVFGGKFDKRLGALKKVIMAVFAVMAIIPLIFVRLPATTEKKVVDLDLPTYMDLCMPQDASEAATQIQCNRIVGNKVAWNGVFKSVKVTGITNEVAKMVNVFPAFIGDSLRCIYGKYYGDCDDESLSENDQAYCKLMTSLGYECHLAEHDKFTFSVSLTVLDGDRSLSLSADAGNNFRETLMALEPGDEVMIKGTLSDGLGTASPHLKLKEITCTSRELAVMQMVGTEDEDFYMNLFEESFQVGFNFFWYPIVEYVPHISGKPVEPI